MVTGVSTLGVITGATSLGVVDVFATTLTGNLTGNVTGNVTGNLTGDVTGDGSNLTGITTLIQAGDNVTVTMLLVSPQFLQQVFLLLKLEQILLSLLVSLLLVLLLE